ncbi:hypothetical protein BDZ97DRAFT_826667 [Flammula alnicola]|nr:hypothetical protein BDZ97DRAFT_826667 [Flammula alnicola]
MAPVEDTTGHWDHYLPTLDDIYSSSPAFLMPNQATSSLTPSSRDPSGYRGGMSSIRGSSALLHSKSLDENFYDKYGASGYASSSSSTSGSTRRQQSIPFSSWSFPTNDPSTRPSASSSKSGGIIDSPEVPKHVGFKSQSPLACHPTLSRDLPPADSDIDYMDHDTALYHHSSPSSSEDLLSPLHLYQSWQGNKLPLNPLQEDIYHSGMMYPGKLGPLHDLQDMPSVVENDEDYHPDHLCAPLFWLSPGSIDTDLDDESSMSSSTSSLSPEYQESELRHSSTESEEEEEYDDERYFAHSSPPMCHDNDRYHQLEQYPSHFDLYHPIPSPVNDNDEALQPLSLSPPHGDRLPSESPLLQLAPLPPAGPDDDKRALGLPPFSKPIPFFPSLYHFDDESTTVPCSPSRRRSTDLPSLDGDPFNLQEGSSSESDVSTASDPPQRAFWLSLPGADTDDDLIPRELGSKNYVPDPMIAVPTTPPSSSSDGLLLLDLDANDLPPPRSPSPENFQLDPSVLAELAGDETGEEAQKLPLYLMDAELSPLQSSNDLL